MIGATKDTKDTKTRNSLKKEFFFVHFVFSCFVVPQLRRGGG